MITGALKKILGTSHEREIKRLRPRVEQINVLEPTISKLSDSELKGEDGRSSSMKLENGASLDDILPEAVRGLPRRGEAHPQDEALRRAAHRSGWCSTRGRSPRCGPAKGRRSSRTLPCYLNALEGKGRARRHRERLLGDARRGVDGAPLRLPRPVDPQDGRELAGGVREEGRVPRRRDLRPEQRVRLRLPPRQHEVLPARSTTRSASSSYAIVDEVDSILVDEARTPLIISGQGEPSSHKYRQINEVIPRLRKDEHYVVVDEKQHSVTLTDDGVDAAQKLMGNLEPRYDPVNPRGRFYILKISVSARTFALQART